MVDKIKNVSSKAIIAFTAIMLVAVFITKGLLGYVAETTAFKNGSLETYTITATDFEWNGIREKNGRIITTDNDPQMTLEKSQKFTALKFYMDASIHPGEMVVYYTEPGDAGFSVQKRLWIVPDDEIGWYKVETSLKNVTALRVDPTMYAGNVLVFGEFIFNQEKPIGAYFAVSYGDVFNLLIYTGIISSILKFLQEIIKKEID